MVEKLVEGDHRSELSPVMGDDSEAKAYLAKVRGKRRAPRLKIVQQPGEPLDLQKSIKEGDVDIFTLLNSFGTTSVDFQMRALGDLLKATCHSSKTKPFESGDVNAAVAAIHGIAPRDEVEAMLSVQMIAIHTAAMHYLTTLPKSENIKQQDSTGNIAVKLLRTFASHMETLNRYRGNGSQQKVVVEHVNVHAGAQAIVGNVEHAAGGGGNLKK